MYMSHMMQFYTQYYKALLLKLNLGWAGVQCMFIGHTMFNLPNSDLDCLVPVETLAEGGVCVCVYVCVCVCVCVCVQRHYSLVYM